MLRTGYNSMQQVNAIQAPARLLEMYAFGAHNLRQFEHQCCIAMSCLKTGSLLSIKSLRASCSEARFFLVFIFFVLFKEKGSTGCRKKMCWCKGRRKRLMWKVHKCHICCVKSAYPEIFYLQLTLPNSPCWLICTIFSRLLSALSISFTSKYRNLKLCFDTNRKNIPGAQC